MAKKDRNGERITRESLRHHNQRVPRLGYYLIVTNTQETEKSYFEGLRDSLPHELQGKLVIKVENTKTELLIKKCAEFMSFDPQYREPWIVFDRDRVQNFDKIIEEAGEKEINVGWSNPCFEIWLFAYYKKMPAIQESKSCCSMFARLYKAKTGLEYDKADKNLYRKIFETGDEVKALKEARQKHNDCIRRRNIIPSKMCPCTTVYELVEDIKGKIQSNEEDTDIKCCNRFNSTNIQFEKE